MLLLFLYLSLVNLLLLSSYNERSAHRGLDCFFEVENNMFNNLFSVRIFQTKLLEISVRGYNFLYLSNSLKILNSKANSVEHIQLYKKPCGNMVVFLNLNSICKFYYLVLPYNHSYYPAITSSTLYSNLAISCSCQ